MPEKLVQQPALTWEITCAGRFMQDDERIERCDVRVVAVQPWIPVAENLKCFF